MEAADKREKEKNGQPMKEKIQKRDIIILTILWLSYLAFNGILLAGHELWRDEANVWLIARELSVPELFAQIRFQGHPCLWYLLVMPFAKAGLPFQTISVLSYVLMGITAGIFVYRAPFHPVTKLCCLFSPVFSYYYSVVARNYCLIALFLVVLAAFYRERKRKPVVCGLLLGLLVQADTIALAPAGLISLMWLWEAVSESVRKKQKNEAMQAAKGLWIPLASLLLWIYEFHGVSDSPEYQMQDMGFTSLLTEIKNFSLHILSRMTGAGKTADLLLILLFLAAGIWLGTKKKNFFPVIVAAGTFLFEALFSVLVYQLHIWHYIAIVFAVIWCFWILLETDGESAGQAGGTKEAARILPEIFLIIISILMLVQWNSAEESSSLRNALSGVYSDGVNAASYIREHVPEDSLIVSTDVSEASTVLAYLGRKYQFYYAGNGKIETFADYTEEQKGGIEYADLLDWISDTFPDKKSFYILKCEQNCISSFEPGEENSRICYETMTDTAKGEAYTLYEIEIP